LSACDFIAIKSIGVSEKSLFFQRYSESNDIYQLSLKNKIKCIRSLIALQKKSMKNVKTVHEVCQANVVVVIVNVTVAPLEQIGVVVLKGA